MPLKLIIDGYNLIRQSDSLSIIDARNLEQGREALLERLAAYHKVRAHPITVVFDGWGGFEPVSTRTRHKGIEVIYTGKGETADEWIQRRVGGVRYGAVVTSDREIQRHAERAGLSAIPSNEFERKMEVTLGSALGGDAIYEAWDEEESIEAPKKGSARQLSKKEKKRQAILKKL